MEEIRESGKLPDEEKLKSAIKDFADRFQPTEDKEEDDKKSDDKKSDDDKKSGEAKKSDDETAEMDAKAEEK